MSGTPGWRRYLRFWGAEPAADVDAEFAFHVDMRIEELVAQGLSPADARAEALRGFGDMRHVKNICQTLAEERETAVRRTQWWSDWHQDVRCALRQLRVSPVLTAVVTVTIALGIGATVSVFSVLYAVLLRPLPFADSDRVVMVFESGPTFQRGNASVGHFHDWTEQGTVFEQTAAMRPATYNLSDGEPERVSGWRVTPGYFRVADVPAAIGRYFDERDVRDGASRVAVLGHGLWQRRFASDPAIVGRTIALNGEAHTVIGVAGREHALRTASAEIWTPLLFTPEQRANYGTHAFPVIAKLKPGITRDAAQADMERVTRRIAEREPANMAERGVNVMRYDDMLLGEFRTPLYVLLASVVFVLLIGSVNVANLLLARATTRRREIAIRAAIGGGRWRIVRQLLTESVVLAAIGGAAGVALASIGIRLFVAFAPPELPRLPDAGLQLEVLLFAVAITLLTGIAFGLAPAWRTARADLLPTLREGGRSALPAGQDRLRGALVVAEIAVAIVLLVGAGLFIRSAWRLQQVPLGFDARGTLTARVALPPERYGTDELVADAYRRMLEQARAIPGVAHAGASTSVPLGGGNVDAAMRAEGRTFPPSAAPSPQIRLISDGYVEAIGIPLLRGRSLQAADMAPGAPLVVLVNERLARQVWPGDDPVGKRVSTWTPTLEPVWREVVGVVADVRSSGPAKPPTTDLFIPYTQPPPLAWDNPYQRSMALVVRTGGDPAGLADPLRRAVWAVDPSLPLFAVRTMGEMVGLATGGSRFSTSLLMLLAAAGLLLAAVGIYGVIAYFVTQRTPEIGLRLALGAPPRSVLLMVLRHGAALAATGIGLGLVAALAATRLVTSLLFEIGPTDVPTYAVGAGGLFLVALMACAIPAARAVQVSPIRSLADS